MIKKTLLTVLGFLILACAWAQNYQALHGSPYSGSLSNDYNPAAILNSPYAWDVTVIGLQAKLLTNSFQVGNASLLKATDTLLINTKTGNFARYALASADMHLFNARVSLNRHQAFGFGLNLRNYVRLVAGPYNYADSTIHTNDFLAINQGNTPLSANGVQASWLEGYATFGQVIFEDDGARLQAGVTVNVLYSLSGAYVYGTNGTYTPNGTGYQITNAAMQYAYSGNYDRYSPGEGFFHKFKTAVKTGDPGVSFSAGGEYVQKNGDDWGRVDKSGMDAYNWKLSVAILDLGFSRSKLGKESAAFSGIKGDVTDTTLQNSFSNITSLTQFNDSVKSRVSEFIYQSSNAKSFSVATPARAMVNFDERLSGYWAINGELTVNFSGLHSIVANVEELNLITVTPRWEKSEIGAYLPIEVTTQGHFWVGGAIKAGPLLIGLHNLGWLVSKKDFPNGGGYLAIIIHPGIHEKDGIPCPKY